MVFSWIIWAAILFNVGFMLFHLFFWRLLGWPESLKVSGSINVAVTQTLNVMLVYVFGAYATALLGIALTPNQAGLLLLAAGAGFWLIRASAQILVFGLRHRLSKVLLLTFVGGAALHLWAAAHSYAR